MWLGKVYSDRKQHPQAQRAWEKAEEVIKPDSPERAHLLSNLGLSAAYRKDYQQAIDYYERAIAIRRGVGLFWAQLAVAQLRLGRDDEAWENFGRAVARARNEPGVFQLRGQELYQRGRYGQAVADFRVWVTMRPEDPVARHNLEAAEQMLLQSRP